MATFSGRFKECRKMAAKFKETTEWCGKDLLGELLAGMYYPCTVNAALSCELYLKAIMIFYSNTSTFHSGHNLQELFGQIPGEAQGRIKELFCSRMDSISLEAILQKEGNDFENWRYAFQNGKENMVVDICGLLALMHSLANYVAELGEKV